MKFKSYQNKSDVIPGNMPKSKKRNSISQTKETINQSQGNDQSWAGLLNSQGLPMLPFATIPSSVDMNLVVALAQVMTMNTLSALAQNQSIPQITLQDPKAERKQLMLTLQERLKNRKSNPQPPVLKKKKIIKNQEYSIQSQSKISPLELLAFTTAHYAHDNSMDSSTNHRESFSQLFESEKSPGVLTALQSGYPTIDWNKFGSIQSPSPEVLQSILRNVSETQNQT